MADDADRPSKEHTKGAAHRSGNPAVRAAADAKSEARSASRTPQNLDSPRWLLPVMLGLMILGVLWIVVFYLTDGGVPLPIGYWNIAIGAGLIMVGFVLSTRWK